jgi:hypothetical protein
MIREIFLKVIIFCIEVATWKNMSFGAALVACIAWTMDKQEDTMNNIMYDSWSQYIRRQRTRHSGGAAYYMLVISERLCRPTRHEFWREILPGTEKEFRQIFAGFFFNPDAR